MGEFNTFLYPNDKRGGDYHTHSKIASFHDFVNNIGVFDLGYLGPKFTWSNRRGGSNNIQERINRSLRSTGWLLFYPYATLFDLDDKSLDH